MAIRTTLRRARFVHADPAVESAHHRVADPTRDPDDLEQVIARVGADSEWLCVEIWTADLCVPFAQRPTTTTEKK
jgi:hypothetical protein